MTDQPSESTASVTAQVTLAAPDWQMKVKVTVPAGPTRLRQMLPMVQTLADRVVAGAVQATEAEGRTISCKAGCGACCRQLVPIAEVEARHIRDVTLGLPEPRRSEIQARFAAARQRLEASGMLDKLLRRQEWGEGEGRAIGTEYFAHGIACPFLENESCSIYADRPVACREYLVTSPAENCQRPSAETIHMVRLPLKVWTALARFDEVPAGARIIRWVPLILAPEWAEANPAEPPERAGPELLRQLFDLLCGNAKMAQAQAPEIEPATDPEAANLESPHPA
jgi:Fe-S-cluster containining protein